MASNFTFEIKKFISGLDALDNKKDAAVMMLLETESKRMESYAKQKAPWTDRSGQARRSLGTDVTRQTPTKYRITLAHGVDYGIWLELANEKKYAIVLPTIELYAPNVIKAFEGLLNKMK